MAEVIIHIASAGAGQFKFNPCQRLFCHRSPASDHGLIRDGLERLDSFDEVLFLYAVRMAKII